MSLINKMGFVRSYFITNETLGSCPFLSSKLDSPVIKTLKRYFFTLSELPASIVNKNFLECWTKEGNVKNSKYMLILLGGATGHGKR